MQRIFRLLIIISQVGSCLNDIVTFTVPGKMLKDKISVFWLENIFEETELTLI